MAEHRHARLFARRARPAALPPRGMIRSIVPPRPASISADRVAVGGRHDLDAVVRQSRLAQRRRDRRVDGEALRSASEPPRRIRALPERRQSAAASAVTLGRLSKIMPMTPIGVRTRAMSRPFGRVQRAASRRRPDRADRRSAPSRGHRLEPLGVEPQPVDQRRSPRRRPRALAARISPRLRAQLRGNAPGSPPTACSAGASRSVAGGALARAPIASMSSARLIAPASPDRRGGSIRRARASRARASISVARAAEDRARFGRAIGADAARRSRGRRRSTMARQTPRSNSPSTPTPRPEAGSCRRASARAAPASTIARSGRRQRAGNPLLVGARPASRARAITRRRAPFLEARAADGRRGPRR